MTMKGKYYLLCLAALLLHLPILKAQQEKQAFSLKEAQEYAVVNSHERKNSLRDIEIARQKVKESVAIGLPQINGKFSNNNFVDIPTTLIPDFIGPVVYQVNEEYFGLNPQKDLPAGSAIPAQFGTKYNASAEVGVNQLLFSGSYIVGLMASKAYQEQAVMADAKVKSDIENQVALAYYTVLVTNNNLNIFKDQLTNNKKLAYEMEETFKSGLIEDTDVDQLNLLVADLEAAVTNTIVQIDIAKNNLKLQMGMKLEDQLELSETLDDILNNQSLKALLDKGFQLNSNIDYRLVEGQEHLAELNYKNTKTAYLPTVSAFFNAKADAMRSEYDFFDTDQRWFPTTVYGFQLSWDLWTSGMRHFKAKQSKLEMLKMSEDKYKVSSSLNTQYLNLKSTAVNYFTLYQNKAKSRDLAKKIYDKTQIKYKEGVSSSNDLLNAYNQYLGAESDYIRAVMNYLSAHSELDKILKKY